MPTNLFLLEHDVNPNAVVSPAANGHFQIPAKCLFLLADDDHFNQFVKRYHGTEIAHFDTINKVAIIYRVTYHQTTLAVAQAPLGAPAATMLLDALIYDGARTVMTVGSCGALVTLPENQLLLVASAIRDEGTSFHYLPAANTLELDQSVRDSMALSLAKQRLAVTTVMTWTTDGFFRETVTKTQRAQSVGASVVEMECAALAACARFRGANFGQLLYTADSLANPTDYETRNWGKDGIDAAIEATATCLAAYPDHSN